MLTEIFIFGSEKTYRKFKNVISLLTLKSDSSRKELDAKTSYRY